MQSRKKGWPFFFNSKALRFRADLGILKVSLALNQSIACFSLKKIAERIALDPHDYLFVSLIYVRTIFLNEKEIFEIARIT